ncbi:hypothetical protein LM604_00220 [Candidatus Acetothermia bacterium]|nr:hypothetical protein [Candidatus Acetothermia bacterium]
MQDLTPKVKVEVSRAIWSLLGEESIPRNYDVEELEKDLRPESNRNESAAAITGGAFWYAFEEIKGGDSW